ncbi:hypothetical protein SK128_009750 [Halocaridina rubra]|uniref:Uncharacterized protein n=1 Tax=Halocaridina rubra TaxID=373956 RepID=A0AAN8XR76_HALRR
MTKSNSEKSPRSNVLLYSKLTEDSENDVRDERKIFAYFTTTSSTRLITTTVTAISTCLSTAVAAGGLMSGRLLTVLPNRNARNRKIRQVPCVGRRRLPLDAEGNDQVDETNPPDIDSSLDNTNKPLETSSKEEELHTDGRTERKLTFWSTAFTVMTITSTLALTGTTVTASLLCAVPGVFNSCFLG